MPKQKKKKENLETNLCEIYLAGGCFWGTEHFLKLLGGVLKTEVGFANSNTPNPSYVEVCTGKTNAAETVKVVYDANLISLSKLLGFYFKTIDPTTLNRQSEDIGTQYRTGIYYTNPQDYYTIAQSLDALALEYNAPIVVENLPLENFYTANLYHQAYLEKNPDGYCHISPDLFEMARKANPVKKKK